MIFIKFQEGQGLGNQLWLYCSGLSIAEKLGQSFQILNYENFKAKDFLEIKRSIKNSLDLKNDKDFFNDENQIKAKIETFHERLYYDHNLKYISSYFDERVTSIKKDVLLEGLFQSEKYFFNDLLKLRKYIKLSNKSIHNNPVNPDVCVMNIRGGEYKRHKDLVLKKDYWLKAMENSLNYRKVKKFIIVTDDYRYCKKLFPDLEIISNNIEKCYSTIYNCSNIIISNSSFAYFPCKTGVQKTVIAPKFWARHYEEKLWSSPCNLYKGWKWQSKDGNISTYKECLPIAKKSIQYYEKNFNYLINKEYIPKSSPVYFLPKRLKKVIKLLLSYIFPKHFG